MRVLSWNLRRLRDDRRAIVRVLRAADPDVVCVQEGPRPPVTGRRTLARLAARAGLRLAGGGWPSAGNAILYSPRVSVTDVMLHRFPLNRRFGQSRGVAMATVNGVRFASIHLGLEAPERLAHAAWLVERLGPGPVVVAGDLNEPPGGPSWAALGALVHDPAPDAPATFSVTNLRRRIDAILTTADVTTLEYAAWQPDPGDAAAATDHLPVLSVLDL